MEMPRAIFQLVSQAKTIISLHCSRENGGIEGEKTVEGTERDT